MSLRRILPLGLTLSTILSLAILTANPANAQFSNLNTTPTPTSSAAPTPTLTTSPRTGGATAPAAGNALPTVALLLTSLVLLSLGIFTWKRTAAQSA